MRALAGPSGLAMPTREGKNLAFAEWTVYFHGEFTQKEGLRLLKAAFQGETLRGSRQGWIRLKRAFPTCVVLAWQNPVKFDAAAKFVAQTTGLSRTDFKLAPETASAPPDSREAAASAAAGSGAAAGSAATGTRAETVSATAGADPTQPAPAADPDKRAFAVVAASPPYAEAEAKGPKRALNDASLSPWAVSAHAACSDAAGVPPSWPRLAPLKLCQLLTTTDASVTKPLANHGLLSICIGQGSFAQVFAGQRGGEQVAIKSLDTWSALWEVNAYAAVTPHPRLLRLLDVEVSRESCPYAPPGKRSVWPSPNILLIFPRFARTLQVAKPRWPEEIVHIAMCAVEGLLHLHAHGLVHTDVKPSNLLVSGPDLPDLNKNPDWATFAQRLIQLPAQLRICVGDIGCAQAGNPAQRLLQSRQDRRVRVGGGGAGSWGGGGAGGAGQGGRKDHEGLVPRGIARKRGRGISSGPVDAEGAGREGEGCR